MPSRALKRRGELMRLDRGAGGWRVGAEEGLGEGWEGGNGRRVSDAQGISG